MGGSSTETAYHGFVERGLAEPPETPFRQAADGCVFAERNAATANRLARERPREKSKHPSA